jgi:hypothetical protein
VVGLCVLSASHRPSPFGKGRDLGHNDDADYQGDADTPGETGQSLKRIIKWRRERTINMVNKDYNDRDRDEL